MFRSPYKLRLDAARAVSNPKHILFNSAGIPSKYWDAYTYKFIFEDYSIGSKTVRAVTQKKLWKDAVGSLESLVRRPKSIAFISNPYEQKALMCYYHLIEKLLLKGIEGGAMPDWLMKKWLYGEEGAKAMPLFLGCAGLHSNSERHEAKIYRDCMSQDFTFLTTFAGSFEIMMDYIKKAPDMTFNVKAFKVTA